MHAKVERILIKKRSSCGLLCYLLSLWLSFPTKSCTDNVIVAPAVSITEWNFTPPEQLASIAKGSSIIQSEGLTKTVVTWTADAMLARKQNFDRCKIILVVYFMGLPMPLMIDTQYILVFVSIDLHLLCAYHCNRDSHYLSHIVVNPTFYRITSLQTLSFLASPPIHCNIFFLFSLISCACYHSTVSTLRLIKHHRPNIVS